MVAGLVLVAVGLAAAYWFTQVPEKVAADHRDRALPEHRKAAQAMDRVELTLSLDSFSAGDYTAVNRAREPRVFLRLYRRVSRARARRLRRPRRQSAMARRTLASIDRDRLLVVESRPLLDDTGPVQDAKAITGRERTFLRDAGRALDEYEKAVAYAFAFKRVDDRVVRVIARGFAAVPDRTVFEPAQLTVPLDRLARRLRPFRRRYLRLKPPRELRRDPRLEARALTVIIQEVRRASAAYSRFDNAGAQAAQRRLTRRLRANSRRNGDALSRFVHASSIRRLFDALDKEDTEIRRAYDAL